MSMQLPFRVNDLLLVVVVISSMTIAIIYPDFGSLFQALPIYCSMALFFLSYLSIELTAVWNALKGHSRQIMTFTIMKLIILPIILFFAFNYFAPAYALSALLLTGVSTGVVAPFISNMVKGNSSLVLVVVVITSALAPFTLPVLIKIVTASQVEISFFGMIRMLALVIFVPILAVEALRRLLPGLLATLMKKQVPLSLILLAIINLGVFHRYSHFFKKEPNIIIIASIVAIALSVIYCFMGIIFFWRSSLENQLAGIVMFGNINNVLVLVFSSEFFGPVETLVAAMYVIPFFGLVIPLRYHYYRKTKPFRR
jgi:bile acid:Na+ symporter, BASS family